ncbi:MAG TPA: S8 family serine peptidase [Kofleriaceae bacterium]|nr:S8 family serine peptidase [Kofleriaceae bacterium]
MQYLLALVLAFGAASGLAGCADPVPDPSAPVRARQPGVAKVLVDAHATGADVAYGRGIVLGEIDYGSFRLLLIDERAAGGAAGLAQLGLSVRDDLNRVYLAGRELDTRRPDAVESQLEPALRRDELARARAEGRPVRDGLYLVQLVGPVRDEWLADLAAEGLELVSYLPENAYVVRARGPATAAIALLTGRHDYVQYVGDFHPAYRLSPSLHAAVASGAGGTVDVTVQVVDGPTIDADLADLRSRAIAAGQDRAVLGLRDVELSVDRARLAELAGREYVFHIEERMPRVRLDEVQGQILAGNLDGDRAAGPGYLDFLTGKGFNRSQFGSFVVNVVDDAASLSGHPDLPDDRVAFAHDVTEQGSSQGGHGFLNANIIAGFNAGTGSPMQDARGFHYGLGIAPFARVGATAIFGFSGSSTNQWESAAYAAGARISSNSWGFTNDFDYDADARAYDQIVRDAQTGVPGLQPMLIVFAAGNSGPRSSSVTSPATAKNVITVGASENDRPEASDGCGIGAAGADSANDVADFSSRGPTGLFSELDGRVKPDLMAPGTHIEAGIPQSDYLGSSVCTQYFPFGQTLYGWSSGTSHSCPAVSGGAALVYQDFLNKGRPAPSPAMVKGYLMNSAAYMTGASAGDTLPSNNQGMGRMDLGRAFDATPRLLVDQTAILHDTGQTFTLSGSVASADQPFRVTLAWSDAPGTTAGSPWVNDLDLEVSIGGVTYLGNVFSGEASAPGGTADIKNNVESVFLPAGITGDFTITVRATNLAGDGVPGNDDATDQDFALIAYNASDGSPAIPRVGPSPAALSFSAIAGDVSPASQILSIHNTGTGVLGFRASADTDAPWLTLSSGSGIAPASLTVSVNSAGLAPGQYAGAVTVSAPDAVDAAVSVPVTLTMLSPPAERIADSGFEAGAAAWMFSGSAQRSTGGFPHTGTAYATLGLASSASGSASQAITLPADARSADLSFWLNVTSEETTITTAYDQLLVEVLGTDGEVRATLASFSNLDRGTAGAYLRRGPFDLLGFAGQTVVLRFRAATDVSLVTTFRVDDVLIR